MRVRNAILRTIIGVCFVLSVPASSYAGKQLSVDSADVSGYPEISLSISASGVEDLAEEDVSVFENGKAVKGLRLQMDSSRDETVYLVISLDSSRSIKTSSMIQIKKRVLEMLDAASGKSKIAISRFDDDVLLIKDFSMNRDELSRNVESVTAGGSRTVLYNAIYDGIEKLQSSDGAKRSLVVFTDGKDEGSSLGADDVISFAKENGISLNFIAPGEKTDSSVLRRMSRLTGGVLFKAEETGCGSRMYRYVSQSGADHYLLHFDGDPMLAGQSIQLEARVRRGDLRDRSSITVSYPQERKKEFFKLEPSLIAGISLIGAVAAFAVLFIFFRKRAKAPLPRFGEKRHTRTDPSPDRCPPPYSGVVAVRECAQEEDKTLTPEDEGYDYCRAWLMQKEGPETGKKFPLYWNEITIGRGRQNGLVVNDPTVSPDHARIRLVRNSYYLFDLMSDNGTFLNEKKLLRPKALHDWDEIRIGRTLFVFRGFRPQSGDKIY